MFLSDKIRTNTTIRSDSFHRIKMVLSDKVILVRADSIVMEKEAIKEVNLADQNDHIFINNNNGTRQIEASVGKSPDLTTLIQDQLIHLNKIQDGPRVETGLATPPQILATSLHQLPRMVSKTTEHK